MKRGKRMKGRLAWMSEIGRDGTVKLWLYDQRGRSILREFDREEAILLAVALLETPRVTEQLVMKV